MSDLKPCPFCGAVPYRLDDNVCVSHLDECVFVALGAGEPNNNITWLFTDKPEYIKAWNTRAGDDDA